MRPLRTGAALGPDDPYIERAADSAILQCLRTGQLCHVLAASRTGKTSLVLHAQRSLKIEKKDLKTALVNITGAVLAAKRGADGFDREHFYREFSEEVCAELGLDDGYMPCTNPAEWVDFLTSLPTHPYPISLALDEINILLDIPSADDREAFLATFKVFDEKVRAVQGRSNVSVCLLGYVNPQDLMSKPGLSPFNASHEIPLDDFSLDELLRGLELYKEDIGALPREYIDAVYAQTSGHPYMTAVLIELARTRPASDGEGPEQHVARLVVEAFITIDLAREPVLDFAATQLKISGHAWELRRLEVYEQVLERGALERDKVDPHDAADLQIAGLVRLDNSRLVVRNEIVRQRFDKPWIERRKHAVSRAFFAGAIERWESGGKKDKDLFSLAEIETEASKGASWELTREETQFLSRSMTRIAKTSRRYVIYTSAAIGTMILLVAWSVRVEMRMRRVNEELDTKRTQFEHEAEMLQGTIKSAYVAHEDAIREQKRLRKLIDRCLKINNEANDLENICRGTASEP